jgi:hypothetical protein
MIGILVLFVRPRFKVIGVTTGAIGFIGGRSPYDGFAVTLMAGGTVWVASMISGIGRG